MRTNVLPAIDEIAGRWHGNFTKIDHSIASLLYSLLDTIVDEYFPVIDHVADIVETVEERVFEKFDESALEEIFSLKKSLLAMRRVVAPERDLINIFIRRESPLFGSGSVIYFQDVYDHLVRVTDSIDIYRDLLSSALQRAPSSPLASALTKDTSERRQRILLAEDSLTTRSLEKSILESAGYDVVAAADGSDAWRILQERGADLVVADVEMPGMDGFALCEAIRRSLRFRELPIVLVTALESATDKARGLEIGADAYLPKSAFDQRQLLDTIAQLL